MTQEPGRKIVSKAEYAKIQGIRTGLGLSALCLMGMAAICGIGALWCVIQLVALSYDPSHNPGQEWKTIFCALAVLPLGIVALFFYKLSSGALERAVSTNPGVPLTSANTAAIPASESLVRASAEPLQAQQSVLLRAAVETTQGKEDQLLRASVGGKEE